MRKKETYICAFIFGGVIGDMNWSDDTVLTLALRFIKEKKKLEEEWNQFLKETAEKEKALHGGEE